MKMSFKEMIEEAFDLKKRPTTEFALMARDRKADGSIDVYEDIIIEHADGYIAAIKVYNKWFDDWIAIDLESDDYSVKRLIAEVQESLNAKLECPIDPSLQPDPTGEK